MANISDVAKKAKVSVATVSRYIRTPQKVAKKSALRVEEAIRELNYKPNLLARSFSENRSYTVLVLAPDITSPFLSKLILGIEEVGMDAGYRIILGEGRITDNRLQGYLELADSGLVDGVVQLLSTDRESLIERQKSKPLVLVGEFEDDAPCATVSIDDKQASKQITNYLISLGHRRIGCLTGINWLNSTRKRLSGYREAMKDHNIEVDERFILEGRFSPESGVVAANKFCKLPQQPTAVVCMNDLMAMGLIHGLRRQGLSVPEQVSVVGFDGIDVSRYFYPTLTTIQQPAKELGRKAMELLLEQLANPEANSDFCEAHILPHELVLRESSGPVKAE